MEKKQVQAPSGMGGLVRYYEEDKSLVKLKPMHVVYLTAAIAVIELALRFIAV